MTYVALWGQPSGIRETRYRHGSAVTTLRACGRSTLHFVGKPRCTANVTVLLHDEVHRFSAHFESQNTTLPKRASKNVKAGTLIIKEDDAQSFSSMSTPVKQPDPAASPSEDAAHRSLFFLSLPVVPSCFKSSVIVCVPRKSKVICLNDCHPVLHLL